MSIDISIEIPRVLAGQTVLVMGVANEWSLAYGIARACRAAGAELILTYPNAAVEKRLRPLAEEWGARCLPCDVQNDSHIKTLANELAGVEIHGLVHAIAFANKDELRGGISQTSRAGFQLALDVSCYSLIALMQHLAPRLALGARVVALTYEGSTKVDGT
ncbi:MAG: SDR family oxidoreductase, partial [Bacteroidetes bacterium]|nr:SDR family oxidoreductase [Bacteroidota bacterium]